jgi:hypothetical protein
MLQGYFEAEMGEAEKPYPARIAPPPAAMTGAVNRAAQALRDGAER